MTGKPRNALDSFARAHRRRPDIPLVRLSDGREIECYTLDYVWARICEAYRTLRVAVKTPVPGGCRSTWPVTLQGPDAAATATRKRASARAIDRMDEAIGWSVLVRSQEDLRAMVALACGIPASRVAKEMRCSRETVYRRRRSACQRIADLLNAGIFENKNF